ncbi:unnamed protein product [Lactuca saligna]|uniref:Uncharacterized protein n=1 Tax=Lactuca saligna TaxID=75948 RepID=A0AA36E0W4_LACSI|nr:unnamed protein product [Lactuca saligna]
MKDYTTIAMDLSCLISSDGGPPRWFYPVAYNRPLKDSLVLMYLPGLEGTGTSLVVHEKALRKTNIRMKVEIPQDTKLVEPLDEACIWRQTRGTATETLGAENKAESI